MENELPPPFDPPGAFEPDDNRNTTPANRDKEALLEQALREHGIERQKLPKRTKRAIELAPPDEPDLLPPEEMPPELEAESEEESVREEMKSKDEERVEESAASVLSEMTQGSVHEERAAEAPKEEEQIVSKAITELKELKQMIGEMTESKQGQLQAPVDQEEPPKPAMKEEDQKPKAVDEKMQAEDPRDSRQDPSVLILSQPRRPFASSLAATSPVKQTSVPVGSSPPQLSATRGLQVASSVSSKPAETSKPVESQKPSIQSNPGAEKEEEEHRRVIQSIFAEYRERVKNQSAKSGDLSDEFLARLQRSLQEKLRALQQRVWEETRGGLEGSGLVGTQAGGLTESVGLSTQAVQTVEAAQKAQGAQSVNTGQNALKTSPSSSSSAPFLDETALDKSALKDFSRSPGAVQARESLAREQETVSKLPPLLSPHLRRALLQQTPREELQSIFAQELEEFRRDAYAQLWQSREIVQGSPQKEWEVSRVSADEKQMLRDRNAFLKATEETLRVREQKTRAMERLLAQKDEQIALLKRENEKLLEFVRVYRPLFKDEVAMRSPVLGHSLRREEEGDAVLAVLESPGQSLRSPNKQARAQAQKAQLALYMREMRTAWSPLQQEEFKPLWDLWEENGRSATQRSAFLAGIIRLGPKQRSEMIQKERAAQETFHAEHRDLIKLVQMREKMRSQRSAELEKRLLNALRLRPRFEWNGELYLDVLEAERVI